MADYINWTGQSGQKYTYWFAHTITPSASDIKSEGGNYMYVKQLQNGNWLPVYIGVADNLSARLSAHERLADAKKAGATHLMTHTTPAGEKARLAEEKDLIAYWKPALNTHHKQAL